MISGGNDILAIKLHLSINDITRTLRLLVFVLPPLMYVLTKRIALGLQRKDREKVLHGRETGTIYRTETGEFFEVHAPLDAYARWKLVQHEDYAPLPIGPTEDANGVRRPGSRRERWRHRISSFYFEDRIAPVSPTELEAAHHDHGHEGSDSLEAHHEEQSAVTAGE